ncbi:MAG: hypothetical protein MUQ30_02070, partial [Anaerolineae bacterium]|nr:hypothetical protein [Anaerolineae bacterium]
MPRSRFQRDGEALVWRHKHEILRVEPWGNDSLRVRVTRNAAIADDLPQALLPAEAGAGNAGAEIVVSETGASIRNGEITAEVSITGGVRFLNAAGEVVLADQQPEVDAIGPAARE